MWIVSRIDFHSVGPGGLLRNTDIMMVDDALHIDYSPYWNDHGVWNRHKILETRHNYFGYLFVQVFRMGDVAGQPIVTRLIVVPYWWLVIPTGILPFLWLVAHYPALLRRFGQFPEGHCASCGYDLRASTHRCPECGAPIKNK